MEKTKNTKIGKMEKDFSKTLSVLSEKSDNIVFYDFYNNKVKLLNNTMYYDCQHLNRNGAKIFSEVLSNKVNEEIKSRMVGAAKKIIMP